MLSKSEAISLLSQDFNKNLCLIEVLKHDLKAKLVYAETDGVALLNCDNIALVSVSGDKARKIVLDILKDVKVAMATDLKTAKLIRDKFKIDTFKGCYQAFWAKTEKLPENPLITIDKMPSTDYNIKVVLDNYRLPMSKNEVETALSTRGAFCCYVDGNIAGFISFHSELSMGMLEVFEPYKRRGVGTELLIRDINYCLSVGRLPFCHIVDGNDKSKNMCEKLGLTFYDGLVYWVG